MTGFPPDFPISHRPDQESCQSRVKNDRGPQKYPAMCATHTEPGQIQGDEDVFERADLVGVISRPGKEKPGIIERVGAHNNPLYLWPERQA